MTTALSGEVRALLEKANIGHLATVGADGWPQVSPVWVDVDGDHILVNSARGRVKVRNVEADPRVALSVADRDDPLTRLLVRGKVVEITEEGAEAHIHALAKKYMGLERWPKLTPGMVRVILRIAPERVAYR